ncbi:hypothetical protein IPC780_22595 [Pseudomonas aeruginosa]|nr:hypothetical protein IPC780_22595 [Pseudomonas aeruginosa]
MSHSVPNALMTGADYLDSLRDGRQVYLNGERVADVTRHRAFRNACRSIAGLYDGLHGEQRDVLTRVDAQGRRSHRFFTPAQNAEDLLGAREAIGCWSRMTYGFMGRTPDYKAAFMSGLEAGAGFYGDYRQNACAWHRAFADRGLFLNHAIINPPLDRSKAIHEMRDVFVHVERETDQGIVVSGAKMLATGSAITNATFVAPVASAQMEAGKAEDFALVFFARMDNPGLRLMCRPSYEERASSPFDYPLSSRFDENDSVLLFDKALIPWEDVLVYRDLRRATGFYAESGFANLYNFQSGIRLGVKLELMIGLLSLGVRANGTQGFRGIQAALGELIALQHLLQALTTAMARDPERNAAGSAVPRLEYANALRIQVPQIWKRVRELLESALGGAPLVTVSGAADLRVQMRLELARLHQELAATMIYVTHDQVEAMTLADKVVVLNGGRVEQVGSPLELYHHPANLFVAGFLGTPKMGFLRGHLSRNQGERCEVALECGARVGLPLCAGELATGSPVTLGIRPEHLNIARPGHAFQGLLRVAADVSERLGSDSFCHVRADSGEMLTLRVRGDFAPDYGAPLELGFDPEHCHLFDSNGQALDKRLQQAA